MVSFFWDRLENTVLGFYTDSQIRLPHQDLCAHFFWPLQFDQVVAEAYRNLIYSRCTVVWRRFGELYLCFRAKSQKIYMPMKCRPMFNFILTEIFAVWLFCFHFECWPQDLILFEYCSLAKEVSQRNVLYLKIQVVSLTFYRPSVTAIPTLMARPSTQIVSYLCAALVGFVTLL